MTTRSASLAAGLFLKGSADEKKSHLPSLWGKNKQRLVEFLFPSVDFWFVQSCFCLRYVFLVEISVDPEPSSWRTEPWVDPNFALVRRFAALCVTFCSVGCYLAMLCSSPKICFFLLFFCSNLLTTGMRWTPFPFVSFLSSPRTVGGDCSFLTLPGKTLSQHSKNVLHCCFSPAFHFCSHVTIMLRVVVAMFDLEIVPFFCWHCAKLPFVRWVSFTYQPVPPKS